MADTFPKCLAFTLTQEGGFVDNPQDPGGATNFGITLGTLRGWLGDDALGVEAIKNISQSTVDAIYRADYWNRVMAESLPAGLDLMVFDHGVNAGPAVSARLLQQALDFTGAAVDGAIGPVTLKAADAADPLTTIAQLAALQSAYYHGLRGYDAFGRGWLARVERRKETAMAMAETASGT